MVNVGSALQARPVSLDTTLKNFLESTVNIYKTIKYNYMLMYLSVLWLLSNNLRMIL